MRSPTLLPPKHIAACRRVRFNKHLPTAEALGAYFATYGRHCRTLHLGHLDAASEQVGRGCGWGVLVGKRSVVACASPLHTACLDGQAACLVVPEALLPDYQPCPWHPQEGCIGEEGLAGLLQRVAPSLQQLVVNQCRVQVGR